VLLRGLALRLELIDFFLQLGDDFLQIGLLLRISPRLWRAHVAIKIRGTKLGNPAVEKANPLSQLAVEHAVGEVHQGRGNSISVHVAEEIRLGPSSKRGRRQQQVPASRCALPRSRRARGARAPTYSC
jgi:hypothetical protein